MNMKVSDTFGQYFVRLPLKASATIVHGNSLHLDWKSLINTTKDKTIKTNQLNIIQANKLEEPIEEYKTVNVIANKVNYIEPPLQEVFVEYDYIIGNPPFYGSKMQSKEQRADVAAVFGDVKNAKTMDYVAAWYIKAARLIQNTKTKAAFVSTNSITQGEQVGILWNEMLNKYGVKIHFAHRTFPQKVL